MADDSAPLIAGPRPALFTSDDFERMFLAGVFGDRRVELRGGVIVETGPIYTTHALVRGKVARRLEDALATTRPDLTVLDEVSIKADAFYPTSDIVVLAFEGGNRAIRPEEVKLVVEVAVSSAADDLGDKKQRYEAIGVPEYWVVDVDAGMLHRFALRDGALAPAPLLKFGEPWASLVITDLAIASDGLT